MVSPLKDLLNTFPNVGHMAEDTVKVIMLKIDSFCLNIKDCQEQSYYNTTSGKENELAIYIPGVGHQLLWVNVLWNQL